MADDMSQGSENSDYEDDGMCEDDDYYDDPDDFMETETDKKKDDPEYFEFELLKVEDVDRLLNESVEALCKSMKVGLVAVLERAFIVYSFHSRKTHDVLIQKSKPKKGVHQFRFTCPSRQVTQI